MMIVKDAMVIIHLAKTNLLRECCNLFNKVIIPELVREEILNGKNKHAEEVNKIEKLISEKLIAVLTVKSNNLIKKANNFNIYRGEAEAVALYWQENADLLATDDDNVRKKKNILDISVVGTPALIIKLFKDKKISIDKYSSAIKKLKEVGWFSSTVFDKMLLEAEK